MALGKKNKFSHNKKRNSGLVYEFLLRKISECVLEGDIRTSKKALGIIKKYYTKGSTLYEEKQLFDTILETRGASKNVANEVLKEVRKSASSLSFRMIDIKKSNLIKEINHSFGKKFFSLYEIDDYKAFASLQLFVNGCNPKGTLTENVQRIKLEESLVSFMTTNRKCVKQEEYKTADELSYGIAVEKYNKKYRTSLNESQKNLLSSYTTSLTVKDGKRKLTKYLGEQRWKLARYLELSHNIKEVKNDRLISNKLTLVESKLRSMDFKDAGQREVESLMMYCKLVEEITSNE